MVLMLAVSIVIVIAGTVAATRLSAVRVRRRPEASQVLFSPLIANRSVAAMPVRRPRLAVTASHFRPGAAPANVSVLADYRKVRASRLRQVRAAAAGAPRPHRPESA
jgi:hypothetical protein